MDAWDPERIERDVIVVTSRPAEEGTRAFQVEAGEDVEPPPLDEAVDHEGALVERMREAGFRLTMVGGGSRSDEVRRFYFRPAD